MKILKILLVLIANIVFFVGYSMIIIMVNFDHNIHPAINILSFILGTVIFGYFSIKFVINNTKTTRWRSRMSFSESEDNNKNDQENSKLEEKSVKRFAMKDKKKNQHDMVSVKVTIILILIGLLLIPGTFIQDMVMERESTKNTAIAETAKKWGRSQSVNGPILYVPVEYEKTIEKTVKVENPKEGESNYETVEEIETYRKDLRILPEELHINGEIIPEIRYKSIYEILLYRSDMNITGNFLLTEDNEYPTTGKIKWEEAFIAVGFSSMKSIKEVVDLSFGEEKIKLEQALCKKDIYDYGLSSEVKIDHEAGKVIPFSYNLKLDGSCDLLFTPLGKETSVELRSSWADPNFTGNFLPNERTILDSGFIAKWNVMHLNREYPQHWVGEGLKNKIKGSRFGAKLIIPVDDYRKISRSVKYLVLFVSLTFLMFFLSESIVKKKIHPVQYILVGLSIVIFFVLLLSLSEHIAFITSYIVAALSTIGMISLYAMSIIKSKKFTGFIALALSMLYIFLYILLENQDYSLLFGSLGLFLALSITMYATRNIDWYNIKYEKDTPVGDSDEKDQTDQL